MSETTLDTIVSCGDNTTASTTTVINESTVPNQKEPKKKKRFSLVERLIAIACLIGIVICFILLFTSDAFKISTNSNDNATLNTIDINAIQCETSECNRLAESLIKAIDLETKPCDDFYQFACGNFIKNNEIPEGKTQITEFTEIDEKLKIQIQKLFNDENQSLNDQIKSLKLPHQLYDACTNISLIENRGLEPMNDQTKTIGGWPVVQGDQWNETNWSLLKTIQDFRKIGFTYEFIFEFNIITDVKNNTLRIIDIDQPYIGLNREYLIKGLSDPIVAAYFEYMVETAIAYGADRNRTEIELRESLEFEIQLAKMSWPMEKRRNSSLLYNPISIEDLSTNYTSIDWLTCINSMLPDDIDVDINEIITVSVPEYFSGLDKLLKITPKRVIANYMMWRIHEVVGSTLTNQVRQIQLKFLGVLSGQTTEVDRWKECIDILQFKLEVAVAALYVRKYFQKDDKLAAEEMVFEIQKVFNQILQQVEWMDTETRQAALEKLRDMDEHIGYPNELDDNEHLDKYYENVQIDSSLYFESMLNITIFKENKQYGKLRQLVNKTDWEKHSAAADVNAYYDSIENSILFPAGILQGKFFSVDRPKYMNYGAIGFIIGHEITHGFDDKGRQFDSNGNLLDWWKEDTKKAYLEKAKCIIDQYSNYTDSVTGLMLNGIAGQGENIADNGGFKLSYLAYLNWRKKNGTELKLPGLDYTPQQLFWLSTAHTWCSLYKPKLKELIITTAAHPPSEFRINGAVSNRKEFSDDFHCPIGSPMNPAKKCLVW